MSAPVRNPAYRVTTERLLIRCWEPADAHQRRAAIRASESELRPWIPFMRDEPRSLFDTIQMLRLQRANFDADQDYRYAVYSLDGDQLLGETGLYTRVGPGAREVGYWIATPHAGNGFATEATAAMVRVGFEVDRVDRIEIHCAPDNPASAAIARKLGFVHEATLRGRFVDSAGDVRDDMIWSLFASDYEDSPARAYKVAAFDCAGGRLL